MKIIIEKHKDKIIRIYNTITQKPKIRNYFNSSTGITNNPFGNGNLSRFAKALCINLDRFLFLNIIYAVG